MGLKRNGFSEEAVTALTHAFKVVFRTDKPLVEAIDREGRMTGVAGDYAGLPAHEARERIVHAIRERDLHLGQAPVDQTVRVHERCDTPIEYIVTAQWFLRVLDFKEQLLAAGEQIDWHPPHMATRYRQWVENLGWDWCLSRQRASRAAAVSALISGRRRSYTDR